MDSPAPAPVQTATLLATCPDQPGVVAAVSTFIYEHHANIVHFSNHHDGDNGQFLVRVEWDLNGFDVPASDFRRVFSPIAEKFQMNWKVALSTRRPKVAIFVSRQDHCLGDLLYRHQVEELKCDIPFVLSNHPDCQKLAEFHGIPYICVPVGKENKAEAEQKQLALLREHDIELIVLARYMQILSTGFIRQYPNQIINIHHSFLPAFIGAKPYHRSYERGVKLVGATSHYVTEVLDEGPIIEQGVIRISHRDSLDDLIRKGRDLERVVLSRAVRWHLENRILLYGNKTAIFE